MVLVIASWIALLISFGCYSFGILLDHGYLKFFLSNSVETGAPYKFSSIFAYLALLLFDLNVWIEEKNTINQLPQ